MSTDATDMAGESKKETPDRNMTGLDQAMLAARKEMGAVGKTGRNDFDKYDYSTLGDYLDVTEPACLKHDLLTSVEEIESEPFQSTSGRMPNGWRVKIATRIKHVPTGEVVEHHQTGEAYDKGDKGFYKAFTGARKFALQGIWNLYGDDDPEKDSVPEDDAPNQRKPQSRSKSSPPATAPTQELKVDPSKFEDWQAVIDRCQSPQRLIDGLDKALTLPAVKDNFKLLDRIVDAIHRRNEAALQNDQWTVEASEPLDKRLFEQFQAKKARELNQEADERFSQ